MSSFNLTGITSPATQCTLALCPLSLAEVLYIPSLAGNTLYLALLSLLLLAQLYLGMEYKTFGFMTGMFGGLVLEILGYAGRVKLHFNPFGINGFLLYIICLTIAPAFLTASIYLCLSRIIVSSSHPSRLKPRTYTMVFITLDIISLLLQASGGAIASIAAKHNPKTAADKKMGDHGVKIMVAGLAFQVVSLLIFMGLWGEFEWSSSRNSAKEAVMEKNGNGDVKAFGGLTISEDSNEFGDVISSSRFRHFKIALWLAAILIFIRSIYRVIELNDGFAGKMANNEPSFMVLEGPMIIIAVFALTLFHPGYSFTGKWNAANWSFRSKV